MAASMKSAEDGFAFVNSSSSEMIDLCDDDDDEFVSESNKGSGRRRKNQNTKKPRYDERKDDAVVLDQVREEDLSEDDVYRQAVGPHRFSFISSWTSAHQFAATKSSHRIPKTLYNELLEFQLNLPIAKNSSIFIRVDESRLDLLRCLITGPFETPYSLGCFFFDILLNDYPQKPPKVQFLTTDAGRVRFNPNLYNCGKVCLSLLGTWSGPSWVPGQSTLLQVLVSIQALILVGEPYFNEPGYEPTRSTPHGQQRSNAYSKKVRENALRAAIAAPLAHLVRGAGPYPEFHEAMTAHFIQQEDALRRQVADWTAKDSKLAKQGAVVIRDLDSLLLAHQEALKLKEQKKNAPPETIEIL